MARKKNGLYDDLNIKERATDRRVEQREKG